ncbi:unnamed protein product [Ostreobium quekettii]|uniref:Uncharacterized protein n=1 Tax=Ostreobium quekettii TaxID=121088 RepID=A0A8S1J909_9CHLO|nr:unnamed protein product [Ostreobium quekettii]|eukprot:evm.model.scf_362EXC.7 EVM.evm.TU.scf_362EXC.7   scf_362EXC:46025-48287(+)
MQMTLQRVLPCLGSGLSLCVFVTVSCARITEDALEWECTFTPNINPCSSQLIGQAQLPENFLERQQYFENMQREKQRILQTEMEDRECSFRPNTGNACEVLAGSKLADRLYESAEERVERLAFKDQDSRQWSRDALSHHHYAQFTFKPQINSRSKKIGQDKTIEELHRCANHRLCVERAKRAAQEQFFKECSFKPDTSLTRAKSCRLLASQQLAQGPPVELLQRVVRYRKRKEQRLAEIRDAQERREAMECTFEPEVRRDVPNQQVIVTCGVVDNVLVS